MLSKEEFYEIKGKISVMKATEKEVEDFMEVVAEIFGMVKEASNDDFYGSQGYEYLLGWSG